MVFPASVHGVENDHERMERIKQYVKEQVAPINHPVGTAAMMKREDGGVVDAELKVYGTSNLRVADVSILPLVRLTNTLNDMYADYYDSQGTFCSHPGSRVRHRRESRRYFLSKKYSNTDEKLQATEILRKSH